MGKTLNFLNSIDLSLDYDETFKNIRKIIGLKDDNQEDLFDNWESVCLNHSFLWDNGIDTPYTNKEKIETIKDFLKYILQEYNNNINNWDDEEYTFFQYYGISKDVINNIKKILNYDNQDDGIKKGNISIQEQLIELTQNVAELTARVKALEKGENDEKISENEKNDVYQFEIHQEVQNIQDENTLYDIKKFTFSNDVFDLIEDNGDYDEDEIEDLKNNKNDSICIFYQDENDGEYFCLSDDEDSYEKEHLKQWVNEKNKMNF